MDTASQRIAEKIAARILPAVADPVSVWEGFGTDLHCDGCDLPVLPSEPQQELALPDGRTLRFHASCAAAWRRLRDILPLLRRQMK
ncbi:MAG TPA: hypothetical protein VKS62_18715 [Methylomirabilota bacterium]|jgi:hypothetical protein|nr:hypothetical protein [Methylomirabilota bacterium]